MTNSTCSITSITDLLDKANRNLLNITTTVAACPEICSMAWGKGNPDLSGIGVNISYIMQAVLTLVCGPILGLVYLSRERLGIEEDAEHRLMKIHNSFVDISVGFNIPVGIAAAIRIGNSPIFEQSFLQILIFMQSYSFFLGGGTILVMEDRTRTIIIFRYWMIQFLLFLIVSALQIKSNSGWISNKELLDNCESYAKIMPAFSYKTISPSFQYVIWALIAIFGLFFCLVLPLTWNVIRIPTSKRFREWAQSATKHRATYILLAGMSMALTGCMIYLICVLEGTRSYLRSITGVDFQDDQWGFGQVIAVFLWIPLCFKIIYFVIRVLIHRVAPGFAFFDIWFGSGFGSAGPRWVKINDERDDKLYP